MKMMLLEECCEILDSMRVPITAADREEGPYPYYGANGIQDYVADFIFDDELVLLAEDGGNFGSKERPIAYRVSGKCWVNNHAHVLKPKPGLDVDYLCYSLMFYNTEGLVNGATRQKLTQATMRKMSIPERPITEQVEIVQKLNRVINIRERRKKQIETFDNLIKARFVEMFGDNKYPTKTVKDVLNDSFWLMPATPKYIEEGIPYITSKNIKNRILDFGDTKFISEEDYLRISRNRPVRPGDILISMIGTLGQTAIVPKGKSFYGQNVYLLRLNNEIINTSFFCEFFNSGDVQNKLTGKSNQSTQAYLKANHVEDLPIPLAPMEIQNKFASFVAQVDKSKVVVQEALNKAQLLFNSLMQQYFG